MEEFKGDWVWIRQILKAVADGVRQDQPNGFVSSDLIKPDRLDAFIAHYDKVFDYTFGS